MDNNTIETMQATCQCGNSNNQSKVAAAELQHKLDLLLRTGSILMESAADTSRIRRTMKRAAAFLSLDERYLHFYINWNVLMVNYSDTEHSFTKFQRCEKHGINMTSITKISKLTWSAIRNDYSLEQYESALEEIRSTPRSFTPWQVAVGGGFACGGFCIQFGCDWPAFFYCSLAAILGFRLRMFLPTRGCNNYIAIGIAAFVATLIAWATTFLSLSPALADFLPAIMHSDTPWHPLMACALFIVPGVPLINFVNDMLDGYIEVGMVRALNTLLMVLAMAFGIAFAIKVCGIDNFVKDLTMIPHHEYWEFAIAAAVSAMGFSTIFSIPRRILPAVALGGIIAVFAVLIHKELLLPVLCALFYIEDLSVMVQVAYFKLTHGKRVFKMTPLHHHFQKEAGSVDALIQKPRMPIHEGKIVVRFWIIGIILAALTFVTLKIR